MIGVFSVKEAECDNNLLKNNNQVSLDILFHIMWELQIKEFRERKGGQSVMAWVKGQSRTCVTTHHCKRLKLSLRCEHTFLWNIHTWEKRQIKEITDAFSTIQQRCCYHYEQAASDRISEAACCSGSIVDVSGTPLIRQSVQWTKHSPGNKPSLK